MGKGFHSKIFGPKVNGAKLPAVKREMPPCKMADENLSKKEKKVEH